MSETWPLFRYRSVNDFLWQELELSQLFCATPTALNDPFDCRVNWRRSLERAISTLAAEKRRARLQQIQTAFSEREPGHDIGLCCFSLKLDDHLMWAHYADSHRGVCLFYDFPHDYFMQRYKPTDGDDLFMVGASQVFYGDDVYFDWLTKGDLDRPHPGDHVENAVTRLFTSKANSWGHEEEFRIVTSRPGRMDFEPQFLKQVTFGFATPPQHREVVVKAARRANKEVEISEVKRSSDSDFGLVFPAIATE